MISFEKKAKLTWHCRRGMLELDIILQRFLASHADTLDETRLALFEQLLTADDPDLYAWLMGYETPVNKELREIVELIQRRDSIL
jgi:antitoxin CptB